MHIQWFTWAQVNSVSALSQCDLYSLDLLDVSRKMTWVLHTDETAAITLLGPSEHQMMSSSDVLVRHMQIRGWEREPKKMHGCPVSETFRGLVI